MLGSRREIATLLKAFGFCCGLYGLANVLQCGIAKAALPKNAVGLKFKLLV
jgi:hypothetical protein